MGPYSIEWVSPFTGVTSLGSGVSAYTQTNLSADTYTFNIIDSCLPINSILPVNVYISSGSCVSITNFSNTICGGSNGSLTAATSNIYGTPIFSLYNNVTGFVYSAASYTNEFVFTTLPYGVYYVIADDGGGSREIEMGYFADRDSADLGADAGAGFGIKLECLEVDMKSHAINRVWVQ
jgi:hypothetical protein